MDDRILDDWILDIGFALFLFLFLCYAAYNYNYSVL